MKGGGPRAEEKGETGVPRCQWGERVEVGGGRVGELKEVGVGRRVRPERAGERGGW